MDQHDCSLLAESGPKKQRFSHRLTATLLCAGLVALSAGCGLLRAPQTVMTAVVPGGQSKGPDPLGLQLQLQRFADEFSAQTSAAIDEYVRRVGTDAARIDGLTWKLGAVSASVSIASSANPKANLLDLVALTTLTRMTIADRVATLTNGQAAQPWLDTARTLESNVWTLAARVLAPSQIKELREAISDWHARNPKVHDAFFARPQEFASMVKTSHEKGAELSSVFSLVSLDPAAGLDPAVREVTLTRLFGERAMFTAQRMPYLLRLQTELLTAQVAQQPQVQRVLTDTARLSDSADRISHAAESASRTAAQLPDRIATERKAVLAALEQQEGKLRDLAAEVNHSLVSAEKMSTSLNITITTFDALMKRFGVGESSTNAAPDTNSPPFNILDYARTAEQVAVMAGQLDTLVKDAGSTLDSPALDKRIANLNVLSERARADAKSVLNHAFLLAAGLILLTLACGIVYRRVGRTLPPGTQNPG